MQYLKCIGKVRNSYGTITHYKLLARNGGVFPIEKDELKLRIQSKDVKVINLKMDSQGRLLDCTPQEIEENTKEMNGANANTEESKDMSDDEIKQLIESLAKDTRGRDERIIVILKELYNKNNELTKKVDELTKVNNEENSVIDRLDNMLEQINASYENTEDLKNDLEKLVVKMEESGKDSEDKYKCPIHSDGVWEESDNEYERKLRQNYFNKGTNSLCTAANESEFQGRLARVADEISETGYNYPIPIDIPMNVLENLKENMDRKAKAYYQAKQFFTNQIEDYQSALNATKLLAMLDSCKDVAKEIGEDSLKDKISLVEAAKGIPGAIPEMAIAVGRGLPFKKIAKKADEADYKQKYKDKKTTTADKLRLAGTSECIWNTYKKDWKDDKDYDIKSYCIQSLGKLYLGENMLVIHEHMLSEIFKFYKDNIFGYNLKKAEIEEEIYECAVAAYFAATQTLEDSYNVDLVSSYLSPAVNGRIPALMRIAMLMCNIKPEIVEQYVHLLIQGAGKLKKITMNLNTRLTKRTLSLPSNIIE